MESIVKDFWQQFAAYTSQEPPFTFSSGTEPHNYWNKLVSHQDASVLAVDERLWEDSDGEHEDENITSSW
jgi:hypothetical protein